MTYILALIVVRRKKMRVKSTIKFILFIVLIAVLGYVGVFGISNIFGYRLKPFSETIKKGLDLKGGVSVVEQVSATDKEKKGKDFQTKMKQTVQMLNVRVNKLGVSETVVQQEGTDKIRIDVPGKYDTKEVIESVAKAGKLKFVGPDESEIMTGSDVKKATAGPDSQTGLAAIELQLTDSGKNKFATATQKFISQKITIYLDDEVVSTATVQTAITNGVAQISNIQTLTEATREANMINSGALPVTLKTASAKVVGATLGKNALPQGINAGILAVGIIMIFMLIYYRVPGLLADIALLLYVIINLYAYYIVGVTLTLSGIAAFILTVGMAVDANVLIFERMKEELKSGKPIKSALDSGFHRAMSSILDSNITTIIAGVCLYAFGSGSVKGFALTLIIGVVLSMFTAVTVTRTLIKIAANMGWFNKHWTIGTFGVHDLKSMRKGIE